MKDEQIDITRFINIMITEEGFHLMFNQEIIGSISWEEIPSKMKLHHDYLIINEKIYKKTKPSPPIKQYVDGCDLGWC